MHAQLIAFLGSQVGEGILSDSVTNECTVVYISFTSSLLKVGEGLSIAYTCLLKRRSSH